MEKSFLQSKKAKVGLGSAGIGGLVAAILAYLGWEPIAIAAIVGAVIGVPTAAYEHGQGMADSGKNKPVEEPDISPMFPLILPAPEDVVAPVPIIVDGMITGDVTKNYKPEQIEALFLSKCDERFWDAVELYRTFHGGSEPTNYIKAFGEISKGEQLTTPLASCGELNSDDYLSMVHSALKGKKVVMDKITCIKERRCPPSTLGDCGWHLLGLTAPKDR